MKKKEISSHGRLHNSFFTIKVYWSHYYIYLFIFGFCFLGISTIFPFHKIKNCEIGITVKTQSVEMLMIELCKDYLLNDIKGSLEELHLWYLKLGKEISKLIHRLYNCNEFYLCNNGIDLEQHRLIT